MRTPVGVAIGLSLLWSAVSFAGPKLEFGEGSWLQLSVLSQIQATYNDQTVPEADVFLRRCRLIVSGQIADGVQVFAETDNVNAGRYDQPEAATRIQDVFVDMRLARSDHWVKAGLILLPFSFESRSSAGSLLGLDYNAESIKLVNTFVWRDYGAEIHGQVGKRFAYAAGVFDGYDSESGTKNPRCAPRFVGHAAFNALGEVETGWFYSQERLGKKGSYLSLGLGGDVQERASLTPMPDPIPDRVEDSRAWVADVQAGFRVDDRLGLTANAAWHDWDNALLQGTTAFVESGVLYRRAMGGLKFSRQAPDGGGETTDFTLGLGYFHRGHNLRMGLEYRWGDSPESWLAGIQFLL